MRPLRAVLFAPLVAFAVAACGSAGGPGWTYAPAPSVTPAASAEPSDGASAPPPSAAPSASAPASDAPEGPVVTVIAENALRFETPELTAPADTAFTLEFDNRDPTVPHNVVINDPGGSRVDIGDTSFFTGPEVRTYEVPALAAGEYPFLCEVHPTAMTGVLTVE